MDLRDKRLVASLAKAIAEVCKGLAHLKIMHVCGTHEYVISRFGLRHLLPDNLEVISGPGCPVCCTPASDIDTLVNLSLRKNVVVTCFGDMLRVNGSQMSLAEAKARGANTKIVYSILDAVEFAREHEDLEVIHSAIGFETTAPTTAAVLTNSLPGNFSILSSHRIIPPAMDFILSQSDTCIDGFIAPGHVSVIIGANAYKSVAKIYKRPVVVSGFEPADILYSIYLITRQIKKKQAKVENEYSRAVDWQPQKKAIAMIKRTFDVTDSFWRGLGKIRQSGLILRKPLRRFDCFYKFKLKKAKEEIVGFRHCRCADVLKGKIHPDECPAFGHACNPEHPLGPCMVSYEGSCAIFYSYRNNKKLKVRAKGVKAHDSKLGG
ncbi:MAG: hydrogenase formation protein HypD [Candidatus Omnitrophota bacterium]